ncbi:MAG: type II toxin-antitoxin system Phd/YefM family antitoxin [Alphaproteobacteria bacterium]|nr:type II toxin-antitoxin system Phd/YefM family antitoxin [Alphaproteobacteria bacterium]
MATFSTSDLSRRSGDIIAEALRRPVTIVQRKKPRLVLLSVEDYRKLVARADTRKAGTLRDMPDALFEEFRRAVDGYEREGKKR